MNEGLAARRRTRRVMVGDVAVGAGAPVSVQSMTNTDTSDAAATISQIRALEAAGCEIVRVAVPDMEAAARLGEIRHAAGIPLVADIHFDHRLALRALDEGVDGLRLNPGNIGSRRRVAEVARAASGRGVPIRIGVNAGSLEKEILERHGRPTAQALVESALRHVALLEDEGFGDIKISLKASSVPMTVEAYRLISRKVDYPLHIGVTEAGTLFSGTVKSAVGLGVLLAEGIGDTLRVSITGDPVDEVRIGWEILKALGLRERGVTVVSCPTCGRLGFDCIAVASEVERRLSHVAEPVTVAVMGCVVNGPGEAREADIGVAGGRGAAMLYVRGEQVRKVSGEAVVEAVVEEVERLVADRSGRPSSAAG
ncbi:MAG TPA: flavodoxin-dependent (E)-4-hydroxy-3-methylbut-2-enyl-diphosphate synthase [Deltaproteobacteria bacterium]|nr:flavodoxin-dependent (E)-4-hydroxy-3-methylbut-2-enyl-diphosphate synthase [Deltaproteobacteria bacterium]